MAPRARKFNRPPAAKPTGGKRGGINRSDPRRLLAVADLIARQWTSGRIIAELTGENAPPLFRAPDGRPLARRTIEGYIGAVWKQWKADVEAELPVRLLQLRLTFRDLIDRAVGAGAFSAAVQAADKLARIEGAYQDKIEHSGPGGGPLMVSVEDVRARIRERLERQVEETAKSESAPINGTAKPKPSG